MLADLSLRLIGRESRRAAEKATQPGEECMSDDHGAPMDYKAHNNTYSGFLSLLKWGTILSALTGLLVVFLIAPKG